MPPQHTVYLAAVIIPLRSASVYRWLEIGVFQRNAILGNHFFYNCFFICLNYNQAVLEIKSNIEAEIYLNQKLQLDLLEILSELFQRIAHRLVPNAEAFPGVR